MISRKCLGLTPILSYCNHMIVDDYNVVYNNIIKKGGD